MLITWSSELTKHCLLNCSKISTENSSYKFHTGQRTLNVYRLLGSCYIIYYFFKGRFYKKIKKKLHC